MLKNKMWTSIAIILSCGLGVGALQGVAWAAAVREVVDGDTLVLANGERVRLLGIDAPEIKDAYDRNLHTSQRAHVPKKVVDRFAGEAKKAAAKWAAGQDLKLSYDPANQAINNRDSYGRTLAYVCRESDGTCLSDYLLTGGYALVYRRFNFSQKSNFIQLEDQARVARKGIWHYQQAGPKSKKPNK
jgi:micrococcal nuclease